MHGVFWLVIPLIFFFGFRGRWGGRPRVRRRDLDRGDQEYIAELQAVIEQQRGQIESLEARVARVEEGLDFAERVLAERPAGRLPM
jgi:hypothetical protein